MKTLDQRIKHAENAAKNAEEGTPEHAAATARVEELNSLKQDGLGHSQDDLNRVDKKAKDGYEAAIKETLGMTLEEFAEVMAGVEESLSDAGSGDEADGNTLERVQSALGERDQAIEDEREARLKFERELRTERITNRLGEAFKAAGLNEKYLTPAQRLASYDELIEKSMKGEEVEDEEFKTIAESVKEASPVWFEAEQNTDWQGIPPSPEGTPPEQITDEQRARMSAPVF